MWFVFALGSALFAALTSILAKVGIEGVNSTLATAIRTVVVLAFVFLHEPFTAKSMVGCALVAAGTLFMVL